MDRLMTLVLDTCALLWLTLDPRNLSPKALEAIASCDKMAVCSISIWEIGVKWKAGKLDLGLDYAEYVSKLNECRKFELVSVDTILWVKSVRLDWDHRDPADRLIVSLASTLNATIITADREITSYYRLCLA